MRKTHVDKDKDKDKDKIKDEEEPESSPGFTAQDNLLAFLPRIQLEVDNVPANIQKAQFKKQIQHFLIKCLTNWLGQVLLGLCFILKSYEHLIQQIILT